MTTKYHTEMTAFISLAVQEYLFSSNFHFKLRTKTAVTFRTPHNDTKYRQFGLTELDFQNLRFNTPTKRPIHQQEGGYANNNILNI